MVATVIGFLERSNIGQGTWNWGDVAFGFRSGLLLNEPVVTVINYNNQIRQPKLNPVSSFMMGTLPFLPVQKFGKLARVDSLAASYYNGLCLMSSALGLANLFAIQRNIYNLKTTEARTTFDKWIIRAWRTTPYLVLYTNIALITLELRSNYMKAAVALTVTFLARLSIAKITPPSWAWYLNPGLRIPMDMVALYYASNKNRFVILVGLIRMPLIKNPLMRFAQPYCPGLINFLKSKGFF